MADRRAQETLDSIGQLPVLPPLADELLAMGMSAHADLDDVLHVVERDPVLAAMVLRMVNSAAFAMAHEVTDLRSAVVLLGAAHVRSLALAAAMSALTHGPDSGWQFEHSFSVACTARLIAQRGVLGDVETAFAGGILHDIGDILVASVMGRSMDPTLPPGVRLTLEREHLGCDHTQLGEALAERWRLPTVLSDAIAHHHHYGDKPWVAAVVAAAENVLDEIDGTCHGDGTPAADALGALGVTDVDAFGSMARELAAASEGGAA